MCDDLDHKQRAAVLEFATEVGIPYRFRDSRYSHDCCVPGYSWDGDVAHWSRSHNCSELIHEIAHWLICPQYRVHKPEFGLGFAPRFSKINPLRMVTAITAAREEEVASALGIAIEACMGMDWKETADDHNWSDDWHFGGDLKCQWKKMGISIDSMGRCRIRKAPKKVIRRGISLNDVLRIARKFRISHGLN